MQQALVAFAGNGVLGLCEVEDDRAVFNDYGIPSANQKVFDRSYQGLGRHEGIVSGDPLRGL